MQMRTKPKLVSSHVKRNNPTARPEAIWRSARIWPCIHESDIMHTNTVGTDRMVTEQSIET